MCVHMQRLWMDGSGKKFSEANKRADPVQLRLASNVPKSVKEPNSLIMKVMQMLCRIDVSGELKDYPIRTLLCSS